MLTSPYAPAVALMLIGVAGGLIESCVEKHVGAERAFYHFAVWLLAGGSMVGCFVARDEPIFWLFATSATLSTIAFGLLLKDLLRKISNA